MFDRTGDNDPRAQRNEKQNDERNHRTYQSLLSDMNSTLEEDKRLGRDGANTIIEQLKRMNERDQRRERRETDRFSTARMGQGGMGGQGGRQDHSIFTPLIDQNQKHHNEFLSRTDLHHRENLFQYRDIRDKLDRIPAKGNKPLISAIQEGFYQFMRAPVWTTLKTLWPTLKGAFSTISGLFFGFGKREKSTVKAIEEQTEFMRTGMIKDQTNMFQRFLRRGIVGSVASGALAGLTGVGRGASGRAQEKKQSGQDLSMVEKVSDKLFKDRTLLDQNKKAQEPTEDLLGKIKTTLTNQVSAFLEVISGQNVTATRIFGDYSQFITNQMNEIGQAVVDGFNTVNNTIIQIEERKFSLFQQLANGVSQFVNMMSYLSGQAVPALVSESHQLVERTDRYNRRLVAQNEVASQQRERQFDNVYTPFQKASIDAANKQEEKLASISANQRTLNETIKDQAEGEDAGTKGGGLLGMLFGRGGIGRKGAAIVASFTKSIVGWVTGAIVAAGKGIGTWLVRNAARVLIYGPFAKIALGAMIIGAAERYILRPFLGWLDGIFGTNMRGGLEDFYESVGETVSNFGSWLWGVVKNLGSSIFESVRSIGGFVWDAFSNAVSWVGSRLMDGVGMFASTIFGGIWHGLTSVGGMLWDGITGLITKVGGWIGGKISDLASTIWSGITSAFSNIISGIGNWIRNKAADAPLIGRFIEGTDTGNDVDEERIVRDSKDSIVSGLRSTVADVYRDFYGELGSRVGDQAQRLGSGALDVSRSAIERIGEVYGLGGSSVDELIQTMRETDVTTKEGQREQVQHLKELKEKEDLSREEMVNLLSQIAEASGVTASNTVPDPSERTEDRKQRDFTGLVPIE